MEHMSHEDQHRQYPIGTTVVALNGERLGALSVVHPHYLLVAQDEAGHANLEVPPHAIARYDGKQLYLSVNRGALTVVDDEEAAGRRLNDESS